MGRENKEYKGQEINNLWEITWYLWNQVPNLFKLTKMNRNWACFESLATTTMNQNCNNEAIPSIFENVDPLCRKFTRIYATTANHIQISLFAIDLVFWAIPLISLWICCVSSHSNTRDHFSWHSAPAWQIHKENHCSPLLFL